MATTKNTTPEQFDDEIEVKEAPLTREETLMSEADILAGLLDMGEAKNDSDAYRRVRIERKGVLKLEFSVRPLSEPEMASCSKQATKYAAGKPGKAKVALDTDAAKMRSLLIYTATIDSDRKKVWDNTQAKAQFNIIQGWEMIDMVLLPGEKEHVLAVIDDASGYTADYEEIAKN